MRALPLLLLLASAPALADHTTTMATDDCARARKLGKTCVLTIEDENIEGQVATNEGEKLTAIEWGKMTSLISVRRHFILEILRSAENLD